MNKLFALAICFALVSNTVSQAGVILVSGPEVDLGDGLVGVTVKAVGTEGDNVSSLFNISFTGVHQVWENAAAGSAAAQRSATLDAQSGTFWNAASFNSFDSVFLLDLEGTGLTTAPGTTFGETNDGSNPSGRTFAPNSPFENFPGIAGMGNLSLNGQVSYLQAGGLAEVDFAYLVMPAGSQVSYTAQFYVANASVPEAVITGTIGGGTGGDGPIVGPGGALDFGYNGQIQTLTLSNTGDEAAEFIGAGFELSGPNLGLFSLLNPDFSDLPAGADREFQVLFNSGSNAQASYEAELTFLTNGGNPVFALTAQVPEPSTVALAGLGMVGLVGLARRRRK